MDEKSAKQHYDYLLAEHYSWMFGGFDQQVEKNLRWFKEHNIRPNFSQNAIDLGSGSGFQSIALSALGFNVTAVDFNQQLLSELTNHDKNKTIDIIQSDILIPKNYSHKAPFEIAVCMGDTLPHLPSEESVSDFFHIIYNLLEPKGCLILSFRDYSSELTGADRFIPVHNDAHKIMTVFLEYHSEYVFIYDLVYEQTDGTWTLEKSVYKKVRLSLDRMKDLLDKANFNIDHLQSNQGMIHMVARKD